MVVEFYGGSLTRYYAGAGLAPRDVDARSGGDEVTDPEEVRRVVVAWREGLAESLAGELAEPLAWDERPDAPCFAASLSDAAYGALLLWAAYADHPELRRPPAVVVPWTADPAWRASTAPGARCTYPHLLQATCWLPQAFGFGFRARTPDGEETDFGSAPALLRELDELQRRTWGRAASDGAAPAAPAAPPSPLEAAAQAAFPLVRDVVAQAVAHRLVVLLDG